MQVAVLAAKLDTVITRLSTLDDIDDRLAKLERWRAFMLGIWAAASVAGGVIGWLVATVTGH